MVKYSTATNAGFVDYHENRGRDIPATWETTAIDAALLVASEWIDDKYGPSFLGYKTAGFLQDREWPRKTAVVSVSIPPYIIPDTEIPERVTNAVYEAAWREMISPGSLSLDFKPNKYNKVTVFGAVAVEYANVSYASDIQMTIPIIESLLAPLIDQSSNYSLLSSSTVRA